MVRRGTEEETHFYGESRPALARFFVLIRFVCEIYVWIFFRTVQNDAATQEESGNVAHGE